jgi:hypothetical protein
VIPLGLASLWAPIWLAFSVAAWADRREHP